LIHGEGALNLARKIRKSVTPYERPPEIESEMEKKLQEYFASDVAIVIVEGLTGRNLAKWRGH